MQNKTVSMNELGAPNTVDVLRSLRLLRSDDPVERKRGISILGTLLGDPRVLQVFEYLYRHDPDSGVREPGLARHQPPGGIYSDAGTGAHRLVPTR